MKKFIYGLVLVALLASSPADAQTPQTGSNLKIGVNVQAYDADLTTYAGITPSANVQTLLGAADYAAFRTSLALVIGTNVQAYDADLTTYAGITPSANIQSLLGAADYAAVRTALALTIGTNVQAYDADLTTYAGITPSANVQTLLGAADYAAFRTSLALVIGTNVQAYDADLTTYAGITPSANVQTLLGAANYAAFRTSLGFIDEDSMATNSDVMFPSQQSVKAYVDAQIIGSGSGDFVGPAVAIDNTLVRFDGTTGKLGQASDVVVDDTENITGVTTLTLGTAGLHLFDTDASHDLVFTVGSNLSVDRAFTLTTGDAARTLDISAASVTVGSFAASYLDDANEATFKATTNLEAGTDYNAYDADLTTYAGITPSANIQTLLGSADNSAARTNLGLAIGTNVQAYDAELAAVAGLTSAADKIPYFTGSGTAAVADFTATGRSIVDDASIAAVKTTLGIRQEYCIGISDATTALTTGTIKENLYFPSAATVLAVRMYVLTAATGGTLLTVDVNEAGTTILSTKLTTDASEKTSLTAATAAVISDTAIAANAEITFDIDAVGSTIAGAGLKVCVEVSL